MTFKQRQMKIVTDLNIQSKQRNHSACSKSLNKHVSSILWQSDAILGKIVQKQQFPCLPRVSQLPLSSFCFLVHFLASKV